MPGPHLSPHQQQPFMHEGAMFHERRLPARDRLCQQRVLWVLGVLLQHGGRPEDGRTLWLHCIPSSCCSMCVRWTPGGAFQKLLWALESKSPNFHLCIKPTSFNMGKIFCVEFQRYPLKFQTKYVTYTLKDMILIQHWNFKRSWIQEL